MNNKRAAWPVIGLAVLVTLACASSGPSLLPVGESAPNFGVTMGSKTVTLENLRGRVVVVNFWSST